MSNTFRYVRMPSSVLLAALISAVVVTGMLCLFVLAFLDYLSATQLLLGASICLAVGFIVAVVPFLEVRRKNYAESNQELLYEELYSRPTARFAIYQFGIVSMRLTLCGVEEDVVMRGDIVSVSREYIGFRNVVKLTLTDTSESRTVLLYSRRPDHVVALIRSLLSRPTDDLAVRPE